MDAEATRLTRNLESDILALLRKFEADSGRGVRDVTLQRWHPPPHAPRGISYESPIISVHVSCY